MSLKSSSLKIALILFTLIFFQKFIAPTILPANDNDPTLPWGYEGGTGPEHWGGIEKDHEKHLMCREGVRQSPINIDHVPGFKLAKLNYHYAKTPINLINNSHTILLKYQSGSFVEWDEEKFELIQIHFHHPSEHRVNGKAYPMEIHLVHKTPEHDYIVIAIFAQTGKYNPAIQKLWSKIPTEIDKVYKYDNESISANELLPS